MLKVEEFLDIKKIEEIRKAAGKGLDENDNFSWHIALKENDMLLGIARLYKYVGGLMIDTPYLITYEKSHYEMLFRTLLLKATTAKFKFAYVKEIEDYYKQFGFEIYKNIMRVKIKDIKFPKLCGGCKGCD